MATAPKSTGDAPEFRSYGENVRYAVVGDELTIKVDLSHRGGISATGKTLRVATTNGNKELPGLPEGLYLGLNAYVYATPKG